MPPEQFRTGQATPSRRGGPRRCRALAAAVAAVALGVTAIGAGPAAAADSGHTAETFTEHRGPFPAQFGLNPCIGTDDAGSIELWISGETETEDGREHTNLSIKGVVHTDSGFIATMQEEDEANLVDGSGTVDVTAEWQIHHPDTGDNFSVHAIFELTIVDGDVITVVEAEDIGDCNRGG